MKAEKRKASRRKARTWLLWGYVHPRDGKLIVFEETRSYADAYEVAKCNNSKALRLRCTEVLPHARR